MTRPRRRDFPPIVVRWLCDIHDRPLDYHDRCLACRVQAIPKETA